MESYYQMKWEYLVVSLGLDRQKDLNGYGLNGWELVIITFEEFGTTYPTAYFKRPMQIRKADKKYSHDTVQDGYVIYNNETLQRLNPLEVLELLNK